jgi:predicted nucleotidyltransferase component of viral defense system
MDQSILKIRDTQKAVLDVFSREAGNFALAGGTALELYYLHHRFSAGLDFFSPVYDISEIDRLISAFSEHLNREIRVESDFIASNRAKARFYTVPFKNSRRPLKIDFVEDVLFDEPEVRKIENVRVYSAENIYFQKIAAIAGTRAEIDETGRQFMEGRGEARDVFDVYMLSKKIKPLHMFLRHVQAPWQKSMVHWYRTFSRQDLKLELIDLGIYDAKFSSAGMIDYLENEIKEFMKEVIE